MSCSRCGRRCHGDRCSVCRSIDRLEDATGYAVDDDLRTVPCASCGEDTPAHAGRYDEDRPGVWRCHTCREADDTAELVTDGGRDPVYHVVCRGCPWESVIQRPRLAETTRGDAEAVAHSHREFFKHDVDLACVDVADPDVSPAGEDPHAGGGSA